MGEVDQSPWSQTSAPMSRNAESRAAGQPSALGRAGVNGAMSAVDRERADDVAASVAHRHSAHRHVTSPFAYRAPFREHVGRVVAYPRWPLVNRAPRRRPAGAAYR